MEFPIIGSYMYSKQQMFKIIRPQNNIQYAPEFKLCH